MIFFRHELLLNDESYLSHDLARKARIVTLDGMVDIRATDEEVVITKSTTHINNEGDRIPVRPPIRKVIKLEPGKTVSVPINLKLGRACLVVEHIIQA